MIPLLGATISLWTLAGIGLGVLTVLAAPVLFVVVLVMLYRRTLGQQPSKVITLPGLQKQVDLGIFTGIITALQAGDRAAMLKEIEALAIRAGDAGGIEALLEKSVYQLLERKLATPGDRPFVLSRVAAALGVSERQLLDLLSGKNAPPPATTNSSPPATTNSSQPVIPVATPLIALALGLLAVGEAAAVPPLRSPQRFYPAETTPVVDPPTFHTPTTGALTPTGQFVAPSGQQPIAGGHYPMAPGRRFMPLRRFLGCW